VKKVDNFRKKEWIFKSKIEKIKRKTKKKKTSEAGTGASVTLRRVNSLELI